MLQKERSVRATAWNILSTLARSRSRASRHLSTRFHLPVTAEASLLPPPAPPSSRKMDSRDSSSTPPVGSETRFRLTMDTINPYVKNMEYAVRGRMPQEAAKIESAIRKVGVVASCRHAVVVFVWCLRKEMVVHSFYS